LPPGDDKYSLNVYITVNVTDNLDNTTSYVLPTPVHVKPPVKLSCPEYFKPNKNINCTANILKIGFKIMSIDFNDSMLINYTISSNIVTIYKVYDSIGVYSLRVKLDDDIFRNLTDIEVKGKQIKKIQIIIYQFNFFFIR
jgi:hypothetical protein